jgi:predicted TPR repeat methyltransferase
VSDAHDAFERAKQLFSDGLGCFAAGRYEDAEQCFAASLALLPGRASTLVNLAATWLKLARPQEALDAADQVLALEADSADAWLHRVTALAQLDRHDEALAGSERLLAIAPTLAPAWSLRAGLLQDLGRRDEAARAFRQAIAQGADPELIGYSLAALGAQAAPPGAPPRYVTSLFDDYAGQFDEHLLHTLRYRGHAELVEHLRAPARGRFRRALDLGCGTGLCGPLVKPLAERLTGVDLSGRMLDKARSLGVYDELVQADIVEHLRSAPPGCDLVLAADVFIYIGDLAPAFGAVHRVLQPGGVFCFSAEPGRADGPGFELLPSLRYAHSEAYLRALAARQGFELVQLLRRPIREEQSQAVEGLFVYLHRR